MSREVKEKIVLDIPPVVIYNGENWSVGKVDHMNNSINIWRNIRIVRGKNEFYDIETKTVSASVLYKAETRCTPLKTVKEW